MQLGAYDVVAPDEGVDGYEGLFVEVGFWLCSPVFLAAFKHEEIGGGTTANGNAEVGGKASPGPGVVGQEACPKGLHVAAVIELAHRRGVALGTYAPMVAQAQADDSTYAFCHSSGLVGEGCDVATEIASMKHHATVVATDKALVVIVCCHGLAACQEQGDEGEHSAQSVDFFIVGGC